MSKPRELPRANALCLVTLLGIAPFSAASLGAGADSTGAPDLDIGAVADEGSAIATQSLAVQDKIGALSQEDEQNQAKKLDSQRDLSAYDEHATAFLGRCGHDFVEGQESLLAQCQREHEQNLQAYRQLKKTQASIQDAINDWKQRKSAAEQEKAALALHFESWEHRMRALLVVKGLATCSSAVDAAAASAEDGAAMENVVHQYQRCWDGGARSRRLLKPAEMSQGTPAFGRPARTPEQAIEEYKRSGAANPHPAKQRSLDNGQVPLPAPPKP